MKDCDANCCAWHERYPSAHCYDLTFCRLHDSLSATKKDKPKPMTIRQAIEQLTEDESWQSNLNDGTRKVVLAFACGNLIETEQRGGNIEIAYQHELAWLKHVNQLFAEDLK